MKEVVLKTNGLTKKYKSFAALDNANLTVYSGDIYGIIGRNGAGKTTLMKMVTGLTDKTSGEFELFHDKSSKMEAQRKRIGCLIENPAFFGNMTAYQNLKYYCIQKGVTDEEKINEVLELVQLTDAANKKFKKFSLGMKQRLGIALAILDDPDLIVLDEPINGLDPIGISELRNTFHKLNRERNLTIIISSHILSELYVVANRFLFIDQGKVIKEITKEELEMECLRCTVLKTDDVKHAVSILEEKLDIYDYKVINDEEVRIYADSTSNSDIVKCLVQNHVSVNEIYGSGVNLEDYFKSLVDVQSGTQDMAEGVEA